MTFIVPYGLHPIVGPGEDQRIGGYKKMLAGPGIRIIDKCAGVGGADDLPALYFQLFDHIIGQGQVGRSAEIVGKIPAVKSVEAFVGGDPKIARRVLHDTGNGIIGKALHPGIAGEIIFI